MASMISFLFYHFLFCTVYDSMCEIVFLMWNCHNDQDSLEEDILYINRTFLAKKKQTKKNLCDMLLLDNNQLWIRKSNSASRCATSHHSVVDYIPIKSCPRLECLTSSAVAVIQQDVWRTFSLVFVLLVSQSPGADLLWAFVWSPLRCCLWVRAEWESEAWPWSPGGIWWLWRGWAAWAYWEGSGSGSDSSRPASTDQRFLHGRKNDTRNVVYILPLHTHTWDEHRSTALCYYCIVQKTT